MAKSKKPVAVVRSMGDMVALVNHNCDFFEGQIKKLAKSNRKLRLLSLVAVGLAIYTAAECRKQEEKVYQLSVRVQKLERDEGE